MITIKKKETKNNLINFNAINKRNKTASISNVKAVIAMSRSLEFFYGLKTDLRSKLDCCDQSVKFTELI